MASEDIVNQGLPPEIERAIQEYAEALVGATDATRGDDEHQRFAGRFADAHIALRDAIRAALQNSGVSVERESSAGVRPVRAVDYVAGFAFDERESKVALILKTRPDWQKGRLNGIGGHIEPGETPLAAMHREFEEETGGSALWQQFATLCGDGFAVHFFCGVTVDPLESLTDEQVVWVAVDDLPDNVLPNLRWLIPMARTQQSRDWPFVIRERIAPDTALSVPVEQTPRGET